MVGLYWPAIIIILITWAWCLQPKPLLLWTLSRGSRPCSGPPDTKQHLKPWWQNIIYTLYWKILVLLPWYIGMENCGKVTLLQDPGSQFLAQSLQAFSPPSSLPPVCAWKNKIINQKMPVLFHNWFSFFGKRYYLLIICSVFLCTAPCLVANCGSKDNEDRGPPPGDKLFWKREVFSTAGALVVVTV